MNRLLIAFVAVLIMFGFRTDPLQADDYAAREWNFRVSLDEKEVGTQQFRMVPDGRFKRLEIEADFRVKILFATVYRYEHRNVETWHGDCLVAINSSTDANGDSYFVSGVLREGSLDINGTMGENKLSGCVSSFAYWNPDFLQNQQLLNSQDGALVDVEVIGPIPDQRLVRGAVQPAVRYQLKSGEIDLQLWYSLDDEWLALESLTQGGRTLRFELM